MQHLYRTYGTGIEKSQFIKIEVLPVPVPFSAVPHVQLSVIFKLDYLGRNTKRKELEDIYDGFLSFLG
jgi:hypothetical protein